MNADIALFKNIRLVRYLIILATLCITTAAWSQQRPPTGEKSLLSGADCVVSGSETWSRLYDEENNVSIGHQLFSSQFYMTAQDSEQVMLTCVASSERFSVLSLQMGVSDNDVRTEAQMTVNIYQSGSVRHTYGAVVPGTLLTTVLDLTDLEVTNPQNFAIEILCDNALYRNLPCALYFPEATLYPNGQFTSLGSESADVGGPPQEQGIEVVNNAPEPTSSRQDAPSSNGGDDIINNLIDNIFDAIFK